MRRAENLLQAQPTHSLAKVIAINLSRSAQQITHLLLLNFGNIAPGDSLAQQFVFPLASSRIGKSASASFKLQRNLDNSCGYPLHHLLMTRPERVKDALVGTSVKSDSILGDRESFGIRLQLHCLGAFSNMLDREDSWARTPRFRLHKVSTRSVFDGDQHDRVATQ